MAAHKGPASSRPRYTRSGSSVAAIPVYHAHHQEYNSEFRFLVSKPGKPSELCSAGLLDVCAAQRM
jgi:hypothetical protein